MPKYASSILLTMLAVACTDAPPSASASGGGGTSSSQPMSGGDSPGGAGQEPGNGGASNEPPDDGGGEDGGDGPEVPSVPLPRIVSYTSSGAHPGGNADDGELNIGNQFRVTREGIALRELGVFDSGADGLADEHVVTVFSLDQLGEGAIATPITSLTVPAGDALPLIDGFRFAPLPAPLALPPGAYATVVYGMDAADPYGVNGGLPASVTGVEDGNYSPWEFVSAESPAYPVGGGNGTLVSTSFRFENGDEPPLRILCMGDSITAGVGGTDAGYRRMLHDLLEAAGVAHQLVGTNRVQEGTLPRDQRLHEGHPGWLIEDGPDNRSGLLDDIDTFMGPNGAHPDVVLMMIGTNDVNLAFDLPNAESRLDRLVQKLFEMQISRLVLAKITVNGNAAKDPNAVTYNEGVARVAARHREAGHDVVLVDMHQALAYPADFTDTLHPNDQGFQKMAKVWFRALTAPTQTEKLLVADAKYPRIRMLPGGELVASVLAHTGDDHIEIFSSTDSGKSFSLVGNIRDEDFETLKSSSPNIFRVPRTVGSLAEGTLIAAIVVDTAHDNDASRARIDVYQSVDKGRSWSFLAKVAESSNGKDFWEPDFSMSDDGAIVMHYADESSDCCSQKLVRVRTYNGTEWSGPTNTVALMSSPALRPGMPVVSELADGRRLLTYEICNQAEAINCRAYYKLSTDGWDYGSTSTMGTPMEDSLGRYFTNTPVTKVLPDGSLFWVGQFLRVGDGSASGLNGQVLFKSPSGNPDGPWQVVEAPVKLTTPTKDGCEGFSPGLQWIADGASLVELQTRRENGICNVYFATGRAD